MFPSGSDNGGPFDPGNPFSGGGFGDVPPGGGMYGGTGENGAEEELFGLEPIDMTDVGGSQKVVDVGLHFHGALRGMMKE